MKQFYTLLFLVCFLFANAQIVSIPDANFKSALLTEEIDTNGNGEIEVSEALSVSALSLDGLAIASLEGIEAFTNLTTIHCSDNQLTNLNTSSLPNLIVLYCNNNQLTNLDLTLNTELIFIVCDHNQLTSIVFGTHDHEVIDISYNQLSTVTLPSIRDPQWTNGTYHLNISGNLYTSIEIPSSLLNGFYCNETLLTTLDLSEVILTDQDGLEILDNSNLQYINIKNGHGDLISIHDNPMLTTICTDTDSIYSNWTQTYLGPEVEYYLTESINSTTYCSFQPGGNFNVIAGNIRLDSDGNGCEPSDVPAVGIAVNESTSTFNLGETFTNLVGNFLTYLPEGTTRTVTPQFASPYYLVSPASYAFSYSSTQNTQTANFCITPNGIHPDLDITIIPVTRARPGFDATYKIHYENKGTQTQSGTVSFEFEDDFTDFVSANPAVATQVANSLTWEFTDLAPFESREVTVVLNVNSPMETPAVNNGDRLDFIAEIYSGADETPIDNSFVMEQEVVGSFDPNDKAVSATVIDLLHLNDYLFYTVRFQNTGTFMAENVVIKDMLSSNLDWTTLQMVSASHEYRATLTMNNKLEFFFEGINLAASVDDEPASHGYVTFKIKPKNSLSVWSTIENTAAIFFDFNFPIVTNSVTTTLNALSVEDFERIEMNLYPNPANNTFSIETDANIKSVAVYNTLGQLVKTVSSELTTIDISELARGAYFVQVVSDKGKAGKKLVKL